MEEPIKSQKEYDSVFEKQVQTAMSTLKISRDQAAKRIKALLNSGLLDSGHPDNPKTQMMIDKFMQNPI